jgi:hypothetical protein
MEWIVMLRLTFSVYQDFRMITIRAHQHCLFIYLVVGRTGPSIDDFQKLLLTISYCHSKLHRMGSAAQTVLVIPSVNLTNSILLSPCPQSGFKARTSLNADAWESAGLYDNGMYLGDACGRSWLLQAAVIMDTGRVVNH